MNTSLPFDDRNYCLLKTLRPDTTWLVRSKADATLLTAKHYPGVEHELALLEECQHLSATPRISHVQDGVLFLLRPENWLLLAGRLAQGALPLHQFFEWALPLVEALAQLHQADILHGALNPDSILFDPAAGKIILDCFAAAHHRHRPGSLADAAAHCQKIHYMAPELTGRTGHAIDYYSDYYALGVVLYQMATAYLPFTGEDSASVIYQQLSTKPRAPHEVLPEVPVQLSHIILKLLQKEPSERYQSLRSLRHDLQQLLNDPNAVFEPDVNASTTPTLHIRHERYGRVEQLQQLRLCQLRSLTEPVKLVAVKGFSGTGKSSLVHGLSDQLDNACFYAESKFEQFERAQPYFGFVQLLNAYFHQRLKEPIAAQEAMRRKLHQHLSTDIGVLAQMIQNMATLLGPCPAVPDLTPKEEEQRFYRLFSGLMRLIADSPMVLFIDDMQWADSGTIDLVRTLCNDSDLRGLLLINAYRDNEVDNQHLYVQMLKQLKQADRLEEISVGNLSPQDVAELVEDMLCHPDAELGEFIHEASGGNAFFISQLVDLFNTRKLFRYDAHRKHFRYQLADLVALNLSSDVVEIALKNIDALDVDTIHLLAIASLIGVEFQPDMLQQLTDKSNVAASLERGLRKKLIARTGTTFHFSHDRIQQAFSTLVDDVQKVHYHQRIGKIYLQQHQSNAKTALQPIASHLNRAVGLLNERERTELIDINLQVARTIRKALAYEEAVKYVKAGLALLPASAVEQRYAFLYLEFELFYSMAAFKRMLELMPDLERLAATEQQRVDITSYYIRAQFILGNHAEGLRYGCKMLRQMDFSAPPAANKLDVFRALVRFLFIKRNMAYREVVDLPAMADPRMINISHILYDMVPSAYMSNENALATYCLMITSLAIRHGNSIYSPYGYIATSCVLGGGMKMIQSAYELGKAALQVSQRYYDITASARTEFVFASCIAHTREPWQDYRECFDSSNRKFDATGETLFRNYNDFFTRVQNLFFSPHDLNHILEENQDVYRLYQKSNETDLIHFEAYILAFINRLRGDASPQGVSYDYDADTYEAFLEQRDNLVVRYRVYTFKSLEHFLFFDTEQAFHYAKQAAAYIPHQIGDTIDHLFSLIYTLSFHATSGHSLLERGIYRFAASMLKRYADNAPQNFTLYHQLYQMSAAFAQGRDREAERAFQLAMGNVGDAQFHRAFAENLFGRLKMTVGLEEIGRHYLGRAMQHYQQFGAFGLMKSISKYYGVHFEAIRSVADNTNLSRQMDIKLVTRASLTLARQLESETLLQQMLEIMRNECGATRTVIIYTSAGTFQIVALSDLNQTQVVEPYPLESESELPHEVLNYVIAREQILRLDDAASARDFYSDPYIQAQKTRSMMVLPMLTHGKLKGLLYAENNLLSYAFTESIVDSVSMILSQLVISLDNASAYGNLEAMVKQRTQQLEEANAKLQLTSETDELTRLRNRVGINGAFYQMISLSERNQKVFAVIMLDIDHFKAVNDQYGHQTGDHVLRALARIVMHNVRESDVCGRWGGEEFLILCPETDLDGAQSLAETLRKRVEAFDFGLGKPLTASFGISAYQADDNQNTLTLRADNNLYRAKELGRNRVIT